MTTSNHETTSAEEAIGFIKAFQDDGVDLKSVSITVEWQ